MTPMHGIATLLDAQHNSTVGNLWQKLEEDCDLTGIKLTPIPHFSWHVAEQYNVPRLKDVLEGLAEASSSFTIRTNGLGLFTGDKPIIYIPIVKNERLIHYHRAIWEMVTDIGHGISQLYAPELWMPHITLAYGDVNRERLMCAMERLSFRNFNWEIQVDNVALISQEEGDLETQDLSFKFRL